METSECDKLSAISDQSQSIGQFLDWLVEEYEVIIPKSITDLLAEYFDIDMEKGDQEKRSILDGLRKGHNERKF